MLDAAHITVLQEQATRAWHGVHASAALPEDEFAALVVEQHRSNFDLWHEEDKARDPAAPDSAIAEVKRSIDRMNQRRNDLMERVDTVLFAAVKQNPDAPLHSETPGMIIDRLSILELKRYHTAEEIQRVGVDDAHRERNQERLRVLCEQRDDLMRCLDELWTEVTAGKRRFKLYRQMKMYNDPALNPVLYNSREVRLKPAEQGSGS
ncbi:MAG TPA: DUF4254 domain-containing protein [Acidobacteriaceae bacterium]|nr:DUF4254 domain-containing protein [Acidobacteriaceae bacterium]